MVISLDLFIIILVLIGCCIATFSDFKYGKISNKVVLVYGIAPIICNWLRIAFEGEWVSYIINSMCVIIIAVILYIFHVWAGGDCKMLVFIALATPDSYYWNYFGIEYNFCFIYAFIFSFGFIFICIDNIKLFVQKRCDVNNQEILKTFKKRIKNYIRAIIYISAIGHIYYLCVYPYADIPAVLFTFVCIICVLAIGKIKIFCNKLIVGLVALFDIALFIITGDMIISSMWYTYLITLTLMALRSISEVFNYEDIDSKNVKQGMILSQETSILLQRSKVKNLPGISDETLKSRLTNEEADAVRRYGKSKNGLEYVRIVRKIPFAVFITSGLCVYIVMGCVFF